MNAGNDLSNSDPQIEEIQVTANHIPPSKSDQTLAITVIYGEQLENTIQYGLDDKLQAIAGLGMARRANSFSAHPTTRGATLRSFGSNAAGRTIVLVDGVPVNDPFGGWVHWNGISSELIDKISLVRGGGAGRWGNGALAGVINIDNKSVVKDETVARLSYGSFNTIKLNGRVSIKSASSGLLISGTHQSSDGFYILSKEQRGLVDVPAENKFDRLNLKYNFELKPNLVWHSGISYLHEDRVNGLENSTNRTKSVRINTGLVNNGADDELKWQLNAFFHDVSFQNTFASVTEDRSSSRVVLDQFDVPSKGYGANGLVTKSFANGTFIEAGFDHRHMEGETNELYRNLGAGFTRQRKAGGVENITGAFVELGKQFSERLLISAGARLDRWEVKEGTREEINTDNNTITRNDTISPKEGSVANYRIGAKYNVSDSLSFQGSVYSGFRVPTLNELFRPYRVRNDIVEANPDLKPERLRGVDVGANINISDELKLELWYFKNWIKDGVANVTLHFGPGFFPPTGFVPAGGSLSQRQNIEEITAEGLDVNLLWQAHRTLKLKASYLYSNPHITKSANAPDLENKRLARSSKHNISFTANYESEAPISAMLELKYSSSQFENLLNTITLESFIQVNVMGFYRLNEGVKFFAGVENMLDEEIQSAISSSGLITITAPRHITFGVSASF